MKTRSAEQYSGDELEVLTETIHYQKWIEDQFYPYLRGRIMEIGAGIGTMAKRWLAYADELHLVEPANNLFPFLRENLRAFTKVSLHHGSLEDALSKNPDLASMGFDAVIMVNVLEHIENDSLVLKLVYRMLRPGGYLLIFVPAMPALYGSLDKKFGHYRRYTKTGLGTVCGKAGYEIICSRYFDMFGAFPWWLVNRVFNSSTLNPRMAKLYDRLVVPFARHAEKIITPPFGKNLVLVGRKTGK
jgi:SAM-dependent methyltransferase